MWFLVGVEGGRLLRVWFLRVFATHGIHLECLGLHIRRQGECKVFE